MDGITVTNPETMWGFLVALIILLKWLIEFISKTSKERRGKSIANVIERMDKLSNDIKKTSSQLDNISVTLTSFESRISFLEQLINSRGFTSISKVKHVKSYEDDL